MKPLDEMTPEEIRIEIAERNGWKLTKVGDWYAMIDPDGREHSSTTGISRTLDVAGLSNWPEDIAAAWELAEEAQAEPHDQYFKLEAIVAVSNKWRATVGYFSRIGLTAPLAICRAWLAWKRSEDK